MQFYSVPTGNYLAGAQSVVENVNNIYDTAVQTGFKVDQVIKQSNANDAVKKAASARRNASVANQATQSFADLKESDIYAKAGEKVSEIMRPAKRMAGIAAATTSFSQGYLQMQENKLRQQENAELKLERERQEKALEGFRQADLKNQQDLIKLQVAQLQANGSNVSLDKNGNLIFESSPSSSTNSTKVASSSLSPTSPSSDTSPLFKTTGIHGSGNLSAEQVKSLALNAGFTNDESDIVVKIAKGESSFNPKAHNPNASTGDNSFGLMQINMIGKLGPARRKQFGIESNEALFDPQTNMNAAYQVFKERGSFEPWTVYRNLKAKGEL